jgi:prepilin-type N-terminal cleavage/methylation domain-containing protein
MNESSMIQDQIDGEKDDKGFTLIEILIAIVLIGILSAVAVVGISSLVSKGSSASCNSTADASRAASAVYFASHSTDAIPNAVTFTQLTTAGTSGAPLVLPTGVTAGLTPFTTLIGSGWTLTMTPGTAIAAPTFAGCPT